MNKEEIQKKVQEAKALAEQSGLSEEDKKVIFQAALTIKFMAGEVGVKPKIEPVVSTGPSAENITISKLCKIAESTAEELKEIIAVDAEPVYLLVEPTGTQKEKRYKATVVILFVEKIIRDKEKLPVKDLTDAVNNSGIAVDNSFSSSIAEYKKYIGKKGKKGSHNMIYFLKGPGLKEAKKILVELIQEVKKV